MLRWLGLMEEAIALAFVLGVTFLEESRLGGQHPMPPNYLTNFRINTYANLDMQI
ncbi:hypothetical protein NDI37_19175 [Funiculus sociatus GB2-A5]|uniref:Uncharacterized protein n=1 Tax=Funiculus sociatus GB2-A5 TaxID=2933946 RepID=A0ABV0JT04_9CYAN|nr:MULTISPECIES: hypothetical protein [unclassified Trichocoleus]MBD1903940.1 hypothetical protein [Trichocoleus sp. FACHB-832]MBD2060809.1 hypothetical protein [Trichocoleus sp. FACHB-6]